MNEPRSIHLPPRTGAALELERGEALRVVDLEGGQVADLFALVRERPVDRLSNGRTFDYEGTLRLTRGNTLWSSESQRLLHIEEDDVGRHDFLYAPCSREMFRRQYDEEPVSCCLDNLATALSPYGIGASDITTPLNLFMNVALSDTGELSVLAPLSRAGEGITLRAETDVVVAVSACSALQCNGGSCGPIGLERVD